MRIRCHNCHEEIDEILLDCFDHNGEDNQIPHKIEALEREEVGYPCVEIITEANWCGEDLSEEGQRDCIHCPKCGEFPFECKVVNVAKPLDIVMFPSEADVISTQTTKNIETQDNMKKKAKPTKSSGFSQPQSITHMHVQVPLSIANRISKSNGGTVVLENNSEAYNVGDLIGFDVVEDLIGSLDTLHEICCDEGKLYEVTYVYSGAGIEPGYVLVQFREMD